MPPRTTGWSLLDASQSSLEFHGAWHKLAESADASTSTQYVGPQYRTNGPASLSFTYDGAFLNLHGS